MFVYVGICKPIRSPANCIFRWTVWKCRHYHELKYHLGVHQWMKETTHVLFPISIHTYIWIDIDRWYKYR